MLRLICWKCDGEKRRTGRVEAVVTPYVVVSLVWLMIEVQQRHDARVGCTEKLRSQDNTSQQMAAAQKTYDRVVTMRATYSKVSKAIRYANKWCWKGGNGNGI